VSAPAELAQRIETIEAGYEYLLAYAAQGRQDETGSDVRRMLSAMRDAMHELGPLVAQRAGERSAAAATEAAAFLAAVDTDARIAHGAISLVLSRPAISSLLVDNLNASIHVRALLTDLFLVDQAFKS
jgi:hypothetical protein